MNNQQSIDRPPQFGKIEATAQAQPLPRHDYKFVKLQVRLTNTDGTPNTAGNILCGDSLRQTFELVPGQFSEWIPCEDTAQIHIRTLSGVCTVAYLASNRPV